MNFEDIARRLATGAMRRENPDLEFRLAAERRAGNEAGRRALEYEDRKKLRAQQLADLIQRAKYARIDRAAKDREDQMNEEILQNKVLSLPTPEEVRAGREADVAEKLGRAHYYESGGGRSNNAIGPTVTLYDEFGNPVVVDRKTGKPLGGGRPPSQGQVLAVPRQAYEAAYDESVQALKPRLQSKLFGMTLRDGITEDSPEYRDLMRQELIANLRKKGFSDEAIRRGGIEMGGGSGEEIVRKGRLPDGTRVGLTRDGRTVPINE